MSQKTSEFAAAPPHTMQGMAFRVSDAWRAKFCTDARQLICRHVKF